MAAKEAEVLELAGREVRITSPDKVLFGERGETKLDLVRYYVAVADPLMRTMGGRPVLMQRFPQGAGGKSFFQKRVPDSAPEWLETTTVQTVNGTPSRALVVADLAHVAWAVNLACLGFHVWPYVAADPEHADELRLDLDPQPGTDFDDGPRGRARAARAARRARHRRATRRPPATAACTSTSGSSRAGTPTRCARAAVAVARELERRRPDILTAAWWKEERGERIFVDYNQNAPHKTVFGAWSVRARKGAQVSAPFAGTSSTRSIPTSSRSPTVPERLAPTATRGSTSAPQSLEPLLEWHARDRADGLMDAPWPPVYPKMPDEPPRVAPSRARQPPQG